MFQRKSRRLKRPRANLFSKAKMIFDFLINRIVKNSLFCLNLQRRLHKLKDPKWNDIEAAAENLRCWELLVLELANAI